VAEEGSAPEHHTLGEGARGLPEGRVHRRGDRYAPGSVSHATRQAGVHVHRDK